MLNRIIVIIAILAATVVYSVYKKNSLESQLVTDTISETVLAKIPSGKFTTLEGAAFDVHELFKTNPPKLLIVHFWGTWCAPCEAELPSLLTFIKGFEGEAGVKFLLVAANDEVMKVKKHLKKFSIKDSSSIIWLLDNESVHRNDYGTTRVPETYVFSSDKTTIRKFIGPQRWENPEYKQLFSEFLQISTHKL